MGVLRSWVPKGLEPWEWGHTHRVPSRPLPGSNGLLRPAPAHFPRRCRNVTLKHQDSAQVPEQLPHPHSEQLQGTRSSRWGPPGLVGQLAHQGCSQDTADV